MPLQSLRSRLTLGVLAVLAVVLVVGGWYVAREANRAERQGLDDRLRRTAELSDDYAQQAIDDQSDDEEDEQLDRVLRATGSSLRVTYAGAELFRAGVPLPGLGSTPLGYTTRLVGGRRLRVFTEPVKDRLPQERARQQATTDLRPVERRQARLRRTLVAIGAAMLLVAGLGTWLAADLVLRPLRRLRGHARQVEHEADLDRRVPTSGPREIRSLAGSFNAMLERLGRSAHDRTLALEATRRFAADAGHELRTPLTSVQAALSTIERHPTMDPSTRAMIVEDALSEQRRLVDLLDGLQALARGDANAVDHDEVDLTDVVARVVRSAEERHPGVRLELDLPEAEVVVHGWEPGLRSVAGNLVENAIRHGRPGGRVAITLSAGDRRTGPVLTVDDDGPGVPEEDREGVFVPFTRLAGTDCPGSGLGLAIVAQQAGHHGAAVRVEDAPLGGARFVVAFRPSPVAVAPA
ncbi:HAMP domain-containing sensor histidine kinase [Patulibacter americanus]|uniref:HAMP domain-containing sensor histidine kinase n=1 Tax=Patulibacter americanus TaxID=588672 RepID=UPI0003B7937F|nr:HAMP domain-containing sensor histidine kinase [Patulibacter americanus]